MTSSEKAQRISMIPLLYIHGAGDEQHLSLCRDLQQTMVDKGIRSLVVAGSTTVQDNFFKRNSKSVLPEDFYFAKKLSPEIENHKIWHTANEPVHRIFCERYDLIFVAVNGQTLKKNIYLSEYLHSRGTVMSDDKHVAAVEKLSEDVMIWLDKKTRQVPVWGCLLIGGMSRRMGRPKHLLEDKNGKTWLEKSIEVLQCCTNRIVIAGKGEIPESCCQYVRLPDIDGAQGPLAGILAAMRWNPDVSWIMAACDMPKITNEALKWLLTHRKAGVWGVVPNNPETQQYEPLLAYYSFQCRVIFEKLYHAGEMRITKVCNEEKLLFPTIPANLTDSWRNCNTPDEIGSE